MGTIRTLLNVPLVNSPPQNPLVNSLFSDACMTSSQLYINVVFLSYRHYNNKLKKMFALQPPVYVIVKQGEDVTPTIIMIV